MLRITPTLIIAAGLAMPLSAQATVGWEFLTTNCATGANCTSDYDGNIYSFTSLGDSSNVSTVDNVSVAGFSTTNDITGEDSFETATVKVWNGYGLGVSSREDGATGTIPHHAMDNDGGYNDLGAIEPDESNDNGDVDAAFFSFAETINLTSVKIGWTNGYACPSTSADEACNADSINDADISVLRYKGPATDAASLRSAIVNQTFTSLIAGSWEFVGNYADLSGYSTNTIDTHGKSSSYWLISAYTSYAGTNVGGNSPNLDFGNDYFKIAGLGGTTTPPPSSEVPEPTSLMLLALGLIGWRMTRNNQNSLSLVA